MGLKIAYCPDHGGTKTVVAAGEQIGEVVHVHDDETEHACTIVDEARETQPVAYPHTAADESVVNDPDEWLTYLEKYVP